MWIAKSSNWNKHISALEKFAIERIIQRCDFAENISNKHRTSNGYTQLKDLIQFCELSFKRSRTVKTLIVILEEATSPYIKQNIKSDFIINKYFTDLKKFIENFDRHRLLADKNQPNPVILQNLTQQLKLYEQQLNQHYFNSLLSEFYNIDYREKNEIERHTKTISDLVDILIPYLVFKGYSQATISEILRHWLKCGYPITVKKFLSFFHFQKREFSFLQYLGENSKEAEDFLELLKSELNVNIIELQENDLDKDFLERDTLKTSGIYAKYSIKALDPHKHVRSNFDQLLKKLVVQRVIIPPSLGQVDALFMFHNHKGFPYFNTRKFLLKISPKVLECGKPGFKPLLPT